MMDTNWQFKRASLAFTATATCFPLVSSSRGAAQAKVSVEL